MVDMAGFDVVIQLSREAVSDAASVAFESAPGERAFLFGGPLHVARELADWPSPVAVSARFEATLAPRVGDADVARVRASLSDLLLAGLPALGALGPLDGQAEVVVPLRFDYLPTLNEVGQWPLDKAEREADGETFPAQHAVGLVVDVRAASVDFTFAGSRSAVVGLLGAADTVALESAVGTALETALAVRAPEARPIPLASLRVRTNVDSAEFDMLASWPTLRWISADTLACFADYRAGPISADAARKDGRSDIDARPHAFVYPSTSGAAASVVPAVPVAVSISIRALRRMALCPAVREHLARAAAAAQHAPTKQREIMAGEHTLTPAERAAYWEAYTAAAAVSGPEAAFTEAAGAAAQLAAVAYLDTAPGVRLVAASTPPPCGGGGARFALDVPAWPDGAATVSRATMRGESGRLVVSLDVQARIPPGVGVDASIEVPARLMVASGARDLVAQVGEPVVTSETRGEGIPGALLGILTLPFGGVGWGFLVAASSAALIDGIVDLVAPRIIAAEVGGVVTGEQATSGASDPTGMSRLDDVGIDADAVTVFGLVGRTLGRWNDLRESVALRIEKIAREVDPDLTPERGFFRKERSCQDGQPREFGYTVRPWREVWRVRVVTRNVVLPLRVEAARVRLGDLGSRSLSEQGLLEPRWADAHPLSAPTTALPGPITVLELPGADRAVEEVRLGVAQTDDLEWEIRTRGADGCIGIRVELALVDARGRPHEVTGFFFPVGLEVDWDPGMAEEMTACTTQLNRELDAERPFEERVALPPWAEVWDPAEWRERREFDRALRERDVAALSRRTLTDILRGGPVGRIR